MSGNSNIVFLKAIKFHKPGFRLVFVTKWKSVHLHLVQNLGVSETGEGMQDMNFKGLKKPIKNKILINVRLLTIQ